MTPLMDTFDVEREKVFIYDIALLLNGYTCGLHPGFLVHDNIFDVDKDTLTRGLRYLVEEKELTNSQYICTINADILDPETLDLLSEYVRAQFTKAKPFLKTKYQELD